MVNQPEKVNLGIKSGDNIGIEMCSDMNVYQNIQA